MGELKVLGSGTSSGVPVIGCRCDVCRSTDPKDKRTRSSVWIRENNLSLLIDTCSDLRAQALLAKIDRVDAVFFTHHHADHVNGLDDLRIFNHIQRTVIPCYASTRTTKEIVRMFPYIFDGLKPEGGGKPRLDMKILDGPVDLHGVTVIPVPVMHGKESVNGFRINNTAYVTDCSFISDESARLLEQLDTLILGTLGLKSHPTHFTLKEALAEIERLKPKRAFLTHLDHSLGHEATSSILPDNVKMAWDGLEIEI